MWSELTWFMWSDLIWMWSEVKCVTVKFLGTKVQCILGWPYNEVTGLYCDYFIWCVSCTVVVLTGFVMCGWVYVGVFGNMCTCIYCVFVLFHLCIFILCVPSFNFLSYILLLLCLCILLVRYVLFCMYCLCVLLPPGVNPIAVNNIYIFFLSWSCMSALLFML